MEQSLKRTLDSTYRIMDDIDKVRNILGPFCDELVDNQAKLIEKTKECMSICAYKRPIISPRYFAACCVILNDLLASNIEQINTLLMATTLYASMSNLETGNAYNQICNELSNIGISIPLNVRLKLEAIIKEKYDKIPSIFELL